MKYFLGDTTTFQLLEAGAISVRLMHGLERAKINDVAAIFRYQKEHGGFDGLLSIKGFGRKMLSDLATFVNENLVVSARKQEDSPMMSLADFYDDKLKKIGPPLSLHYPFVSDFVREMSVIRSLPRPLHTDADHWILLWNQMASMIESLISFDAVRSDLMMSKILSNASDVFTEEQRERDAFFARLDERMSPRLDAYLLDVYTSKLHQCSNRAQNRIRETFSGYRAMLAAHFSGGVAISSIPNAGVRSIQEINKAITEFHKEVESLLDLSDEALEVLFLHHNFDFAELAQNEMEWVAEFKKVHGYYPMMWLLYKLILSRSELAARRFRALQGIGEKRKSPQEFSQISGMTYERARQLRHVGMRNFHHPFLVLRDWKEYPGLDAPYFGEKGELYVRAKHEEPLDDLSFDGFGGLLTVILDVERVELNDKAYYVTRPFGRAISLRGIAEQLGRLGKRGVNTSHEVSIDTILNPWLRDPEWMVTGEQIVADIATNVFGLNIKGDAIIIPKCGINVRNELYRIIKENGKPTHLNDLMDEFQKRYPGHNACTPARIRAYIQLSPQILPMGKSSTYIIDQWKDKYYTGTIRNTIIEVLSTSDEPVSISKLTQEVQSRFPNATISTVSASVSNCPGVKRSRGGFYLANKTYDPHPVARHSSSLPRIKEYKVFLDTHKRIPTVTNPEPEPVLARWYNNARHGCLRLSSEEQLKLDELTAYRHKFLRGGRPCKKNYDN